jgi:large subunit ribosomal protein L10
MLKAQKERIVAELVERLRGSSTLIVADYRGLTMKEIDEVRGEILRHGARFSVVKNTLTKRAAEEAGVTELNEFLDGPTAIAFVGDGDMVSVAKSLNETARRTRILALKGGILDGRTITADQVRELASLPPEEVLRAQTLGVIVGPLNAIVGIFAAPLRDLVAVIDARISQLEEGGAATAPAEASPAEDVTAAAPAGEAPETPTDAAAAPADEARKTPADAATAPGDEAPETPTDAAAPEPEETENKD